MKLLFLTTYRSDIAHEHNFTVKVWKYLSHSLPNCCLGSVLIDDSVVHPLVRIEQSNGCDYYKLVVPLKVTFDDTEMVGIIANFFADIAPNVIHSNMIEGYDVKAARQLGIPIVLTIHIGGIICPRGGGDGFLNYKDDICHEPVSRKCLRCCCRNLPLPRLSYALLHLMPWSWLKVAYCKLKTKRPIFYISATLASVNSIDMRKELLSTFKYATLIAANYKLVELLRLNGLRNNVKLIPHGVEDRQYYSLVIKKDEPIKFFFLSRMQYSKGLHVILKALKSIDKDKYELHVLGDQKDADLKCRLYIKRMKRIAKGMNVIFHGYVDNEGIGSIIKDCHVMIHSTICLEVYGIAIAESLSMGRPVLASRCGGAEMQITDGVNGWTVRPNDAKELHDKICYLIDNPQKIVEASKYCHLPHPIGKYIEQLETLYGEIGGK